MLVQGVVVGATGSAVSTGWKWAASLIAFGVVVLLFGGAAFLGSKKGFSKLFEGADGISSTSKFQWLIWLVAILFAYVAVWVLRAKQGNWGAIQNVPKNVLIVLGSEHPDDGDRQGHHIGGSSAGQPGQQIHAGAAGGRRPGTAGGNPEG